jgi:HD-GYP domain-containing protein (c-di-GMP phosphodiesterase class II)
MNDIALLDELQAVEWVLEEIRAGRPVPVGETRAIACALDVAMHADGSMRLPLQPLSSPAAYTATHLLNVAMLAMGVSERFGFSEEYVLDIGVAALLFDAGTARVPAEILMKPGELTEEERDTIKQHPIYGARVLLGSEENLDLAAIVAYEHHLRIDGGGYPRLRFPRQMHMASRLIQICDVYDAIRTPRPYRTAWPQSIALSFLAERGGFEFDQQLVQTFTLMILEYFPE